MRTVFTVLAALFCYTLNGCKDKPTEPTPTTGWINIETAPTRAYVKVDGNAVGNTPLKIEVQAGRHHVEINLNGYFPVARDTTITVGSTVLIDTVLTALPPNYGLLEILSTPDSAAILLDGSATGKLTPETLVVAPKYYLVELQRLGFKPAKGGVSVLAGNLVSLALQLVPSSSGSLHLTSEPTDAWVFIDGDSTGQRTPYTNDSLPTGTHTVMLRLPGYTDWVTSVTIQANTDVYRHAELSKLTGRLDVFSEPTATISLDGVAKGETPQSFILPIGQHQLTLSRNWYQPWSDTILIEANATVTVTQTLAIKPSYIKLASSPSGADFTLDGVPQSLQTPLLVTVDSGQHVIRLTLPGYFPWDTTVWIAPGDTFTTRSPIVFDQSPVGLIAYTIADSVFTINPDGSDKRLIRVGYIGGSEGLWWSPQGNYLALVCNNGVEIQRHDGSVVRTEPDHISRAYDFCWYANEQYVLHGSYGPGIWRVPTDPLQPLVQLYNNSRGYEHGPAVGPGDTLYAYIYHEWGYHGWIGIDGTDPASPATTVYYRGTQYDEDVDLDWLDDKTIIWEYWGEGLFTLDVSRFRDTVPAPTQVLSDFTYGFRLSTDKQRFIYHRGNNQLMIGATKGFSTSILAERFNGLHEFRFTPGDAGVVCHTDGGIIYVDIATRKKHAIIPGTSLGSGAVSMTR